MSHSQEQIYLLTIRGTLAPPSLEAARQVHNQTAGAPDGVAAAKSLGDLSHMVYVPVNKELAELFIMDLWTSPSGLNQFFSDPQVQQGAGGMGARGGVLHLPSPSAHRTQRPFLRTDSWARCFP